MDRLQQLFWDAYQKNCEIDKIQPQTEDLENLKRMNREKLYKNLKIFINSLLDFKKKLKNSDAEELVQRSNKFENIIKKLEADVRAHIARQYQLRIEIESQKNTIDELNNQLSADKQEIKQLKMKIVQQGKLLDHSRTVDGKRKGLDGKGFLIDLETITAEHNKSIKGMNKMLTDRNLSKGQGIRNILAQSKSQREISHIRSKSEIAKHLHIVIP